VEAARIQTGNGNWGGMKQMRGKGGGRTSIRVSGAAAVAAPSQNREGGEKNSGETFCFLFRGRRNWSFFFQGGDEQRRCYLGRVRDYASRLMSL
jgi:hypothetical protein